MAFPARYVSTNSLSFAMALLFIFIVTNILGFIMALLLISSFTFLAWLRMTRTPWNLLAHRPLDIFTNRIRNIPALVFHHSVTLPVVLGMTFSLGPLLYGSITSGGFVTGFKNWFNFLMLKLKNSGFLLKFEGFAFGNCSRSFSLHNQRKRRHQG